MKTNASGFQKTRILYPSLFLLTIIAEENSQYMDSQIKGPLLAAALAYFEAPSWTP